MTGRKKPHPAQSDVEFMGDSAVSGFVIEERLFPATFSHMHERYVILCTVKYSLPPDRFAGFRKYKDLNGAQLSANVKVKPELMHLESATFFVGTGWNRLLPISLKDQGALVLGSLKIPSDFF
jgi:hypothetical protein